MRNRRILRHVIRVGALGAIVLAVAVLLGPQGSVAQADGQHGQPHVRHFKHVFVIMMENTSFSSLIGNPNAPFINDAAMRYGFATNYTGITHPSQPNYIAATSGSTNGVTSDSDTTLDVPNIVDQLEARDRTWKAYMQSIFAGGNTNKLASSAGNQLYERKHDPFVSYRDVQTNPARMANVVDLSQLDTDLANNTVPNFAWISPDQCHDMHGRGTADVNDPCGFSHEQALIATGDAFLRTTVGAITQSKAWKDEDSAILITWDESDFPFADTSGCCDAVPGGGHVVTLAITSHDGHDDETAQARSSNVAYNHYSLLATVEGALELGCLGFTCDTANVHPMSDLVNERGDN